MRLQEWRFHRAVGASEAHTSLPIPSVSDEEVSRQAGAGFRLQVVSMALGAAFELDCWVWSS